MKTDTSPATLESDDFYHGWDAAWDHEPWNESGSKDWKRGYRESKAAQRENEEELDG